jgi:hypothetical protein
MYGYNTAWKRLTESRPLKSMVKNLRQQKPVIHRQLQLPARIGKILQHMRTLLSPDRLSREVLFQVCVVLVRLWARLRHTEVWQTDVEATEPTETGWNFVLRLKGHTDLDEITVPRLEELAIDPVRHLTEWRRRLRQERADRDGEQETSLWMRSDGRKMSPQDLRDASSHLMQAAGTTDTRGYLLKHMLLTELRERGMRSEEIAEFARHKPGSRTWSVHYMDWNPSMQDAIDKVTEIK